MHSRFRCRRVSSVFVRLRLVEFVRACGGVWVFAVTIFDKGSAQYVPGSDDVHFTIVSLDVDTQHWDHCDGM